jgi:hypothetical protein
MSYVMHGTENFKTELFIRFNSFNLRHNWRHQSQLFKHKFILSWPNFSPPAVEFWSLDILSALLNLSDASRPYHASGGQSPVSHLGDQGLIPIQYMWDLWWAKWHCNRFISQYFAILSVPFHHRPIPIQSCQLTYASRLPHNGGHSSRFPLPA